MIVTESNTRIIEIDNKKIKHTLKLDGVTDYLSYDEKLLEVLMNVKFLPFRDDGRLRLRLYKGGSGINYYLYDIALACHLGYINGANSFVKDMQSYTQYKQSYKLSVDHADNNILNNTLLNLSLMEFTLNMRKSDIVVRVKPPVFLNSAFYNNKYRVQMMWLLSDDEIRNCLGEKLQRFDFKNLSPGQCAFHFLCDTSEQYVECLKWLTKTNFEWSRALKGDRKWFDNGNDCWCLDINKSIRAQEYLSKLPENLFQEFV